MIKKILISIALILIAFLGYASTRPNHFRYERSGLIHSSPDKIYALTSNLKMGALWNPYAQKDPNMKAEFTGTLGEAGSKMDFDGNNEAGSGSLEVLKAIPNQAVDIRLTMTKPISVTNLIEYRLTPEGNDIRFSWAMSGEVGFIGKIIGVLIDCEKMVTKDFEVGIQNLKKICES